MTEDENKKFALSTPKSDLKEVILKTDDPDELKAVTDLFNLNIQKKNLLRKGMLDDLQDKTLEQISKRIGEKGDEFSNRDLLDYYKVIQDNLTKEGEPVKDIPQIQINQQIVNMEGNSDNVDKTKVIDLVKSILHQNYGVIGEGENKDDDK